MLLSVIICTHNPRQDYLQRVLDALKAQTVAREQWELLLVDNASRDPLADRWDLRWHPSARVIREEVLGLTQARLRGIKECQSELLIFVDDDNILAADYLEQALLIASAWPILGAWGGSILPSFEIPPPTWAQPYLVYLALREVKSNQWSNNADDHGALPWGAGLCVRKAVAIEYLRLLSADPVRCNLDRRGQSLCSAGDTDFALVACDLGQGTGLFKNLTVTHLIPARRLEEHYLIRLTEGMAYSHAILNALRGKRPQDASLLRWFWGHFRAFRRGFRELRFYRAWRRGSHAAVKEIACWRTDDKP